MKSPFVDFSEFDSNKIIHGKDVVFEHNPHRFELALLDGILFIDEERAVGFKDMEMDAFWIRGHFPGRAVMPGVLICECAAQLTAFYSSFYGLQGKGFMGLGGLEACKFRSTVVPGDRVTIMIKRKRFRRNILVITEFQAFVGDRLAAEGIIKGAMLSEEPG